MRQTRGFTLIEILIVVGIIAILAAVGMPAYRDYILRSKISEAVSKLSDMRVKLEQYYLDKRTYVGACADATVAPLPKTATGAKYFSYACTLDVATYTVTATGVATEGMSGFEYSINQAGNRTSAITATGWKPNNSCWVLKKDGSC